MSPQLEPPTPTESIETTEPTPFPYDVVDDRTGTPLPTARASGVLRSSEESGTGTAGSTACPDCDGPTVNGAGLFACPDCEWTGRLE